MVVGPKELKQRIEENEKDSLAQLETKIDRYLEGNYEGEAVWIPTGIFEGVRSLAVSKLLQGYTSAGWSISQEHDQREGSHYIFTPSRELPEDYFDPMGS